ncbi:MAG: hypothetical protein DWC03_03840 [Candidatus Poseidoniales archaeon]|nr:MAG: hypothetical protein DWC03_03840 [Candidatus Poseidoniales archaeon]
MNSMPHPVILVEGLDGVGKSTLVHTIATKLHASIIASPPKMPDPFDEHCDLRIRMDQSEPSIRREFYRSGNFYASLLIEEARKDGPVILDRYWPSTASFAVLDAHQPLWEPIGVWPQGLVKPDIMILLTVNEENRIKRMASRGLAMTEEEICLEEKKKSRGNVLNALRCFEPIEIDTSHLNSEEVFNEVMHWLNQAGVLNYDELNNHESTVISDSTNGVRI